MKDGIRQAERLISEKKLNEAEIILKNAMKTMPKNGRVYFNLGNIELFKQNYDSAKMYYAKALELDYKTEKCVLNYATVENNLNIAENAEIYLKEFVDNNTASIYTLDSLIKIYFKTKRFEEAKKISKIMTEKYPELSLGYYYNVVLLLLYKKYKEAKQLLVDMVKNGYIADNSYIFMRIMLIISLKTNDTETATSCLKGLSHEYNHEKSNVSLAILSICEKNYVEAIQYLKEMVLDNTHSFEYHTAVYLFAFCMKQLDVDNYKEVIEAAIHIFNLEYVNDEEHQYILVYEENCKGMLEELN